MQVSLGGYASFIGWIPSISRRLQLVQQTKIDREWRSSNTTLIRYTTHARTSRRPWRPRPVDNMDKQQYKKGYYMNPKKNAVVRRPKGSSHKSHLKYTKSRRRENSFWWEILMQKSNIQEMESPRRKNEMENSCNEWYTAQAWLWKHDQQ